MEIREFIKKYNKYIIIFLVIILIIIIGFIYGKDVTNNNSNDLEFEIPKTEVTKEESNYFIDIKGEVKTPGVYELEKNKRVIDVIKKAGGLTKEADTNYINLSKKINDEMVIIIYSKKEIEEYEKSLEEENTKEIIKYEFIEKECVCPNTINDACIEENNNVTSELKNETKEDNNKIEESEKESNEENKLVNINTATIDELQTLTGVGESKAKSIIEYRKENKFTKIEDIKNVSGIGDSLFEQIKDYITI